MDSAANHESSSCHTIVVCGESSLSSAAISSTAPPLQDSTRSNSDDDSTSKDTGTALHHPSRLAPFTPSGDDAQKVGLRLLKLTNDDVFFDVGCGDGRVLIAAATSTLIDGTSASVAIHGSSSSTTERRDGEGYCNHDHSRRAIRCIGVELDPLLCLRAQEAVQRLVPALLQEQIEIRCGDVLDAVANEIPLEATNTASTKLTEVAAAEADTNDMASLSLQHDCTALYLYLLPQGLVRLKPLLDRIVVERRERQVPELTITDNTHRHPLFRVVTYMFQVHGWVATTVDRTSKAGAPVYLYEFY